MINLKLTSQFVREKFSGAFQGHLVLWEKQTKQTFSFAADEVDKLDAKVAELAPTHDLYLALGTQAERLPPDKRGGADTVNTLPGFFGDIDFANAKESLKKYPPDEETARKVLSEFPLAPTTLVRTGHGLHAHWDLESPLQLATDEDRENAKVLSRDFQRALQQRFAAHNYQIDSVGDLSRLYRIPGTFNHKSTPPKPVEIISQGGRIKLEEAKQLVAEVAPEVTTSTASPTPAKPKKKKKESLADHEKIKAGCAWYRQTIVEGAATCLYSDWFAGASITARCENGEAIFHEYSAKHPKYTRDDAAKMLTEVQGEKSGPRTCASIRKDLGHEAHCAACPHWEKITSPIELGRNGNVPYDPGKVGPIPLGYSGSDFLLRNQQTNQVVKKSANQLGAMPSLLEMAALPFWMDAFTIDDKFNAMAACNSLIQACRAKGPLNASNFRGAGVWKEGERIVVNLGNERIESEKFIYTAPQEPLTLSPDNPPTDALYKLLTTLSWQLKSSAALVFGWAVTAVISGALPWRPHVAVTGPAKAGKSTTLVAMSQALAPMAIVQDGSSTEAGIRQNLGAAARPVLIDEFDVKTRAEAFSAEKIVRLMRSASSATAKVARGTPEGKAFNFSVSASFFVAGINIPICNVADTSRIIRLELRPPDDPERSRAELARLQNEIKDMGPAFCNMAISHAGDILSSISVLRSAMSGLDARQVDNFATLLAGYFVGLNRRAIAPEEAARLVQEHQDAIAEHTEAQEEDDAQECLNALLGCRCRIEEAGAFVERSIGQLLAGVFQGANSVRPTEVLGQHGVMVKGDSFAVATNHPQLTRIFRGTPWADKLWTTALRRLPGAERRDAHYFPDKTRSRLTLLPKTLISLPERDVEF